MPSRSPKFDSPAVAADVLAQLAKDKRVHLELPGGGWLQLDRRLPFLCVYRRRSDDADPGTELGRLGTALNEMLGQIEAGIRAREAGEARLRRFVGKLGAGAELLHHLLGLGAEP